MVVQRSESTALATRDEVSGDLQVAASEAAVQQEIQGALIVAKRFPRDEDASYQKMLRAAARPSFAEDAQWSFPRGGKQITGPSINLAREFARSWTNIRHGVDIIADDAHNRTIRAWAWDLETNVKVTVDDSFQKLIQRKVNGVTQWVMPDERDLRELTNRRAATAKRNCILELLPSDLVDDICQECSATLERGITNDPDATRKAVLKAFLAIHVTADELKGYLGCPVDQASPAQLADLRQIIKSIRDGQTSWKDYGGGKSEGDKPAGPPTGRTTSAPKTKTANGGPTTEPRQRQPGEDEPAKEGGT
jgi:hypothetical protein